VLQIYFVSDRSLTPADPPSRPILEAIEAGVDMVQVREKDLSASDLLALTREIVASAKGRSMVLVNSRFDVALAAGAVGVHLPASGLRAGEIRSAHPGTLRIGVSTHSLEEAVAAEEQGADFVTFGPVFETPSKAEYGPPVGLESLRRVLSRVDLPVFAIGGIRQENVGAVARLPVSGVAVISAIVRSSDKRRTVDLLRVASEPTRGERR
jgi:thiamine-phosphate pyrophosphorylase